MTAVVGLLNKHAIALAADSAVTIGNKNGKKIFNKANKVFTLSKFHPVGIMLYNSANFMNTPWETIIKVYRKQLGKASFKTLVEYQEDFVKFLKSKNYYASTEEQKVHCKKHIALLIVYIFKNTINNYTTNASLTEEENKKLLMVEYEKNIDLYNSNLGTSTDHCSELVDYKIEDFSKYSDDIFDDIINSTGYTHSATLKEKLKLFALLSLKQKRELFDHTGLVFCGFGEDEIYPSLIPIKLSIAFDNRLKFHIEEEKRRKIDNTTLGAICPFAQTDVIETIYSGIDPNLNETFIGSFTSTLTKYNEYILNIIGTSDPVLTAQVKGININDFVEEYMKLNDETKLVKYISPLLTAINSLSKDDLGEMAESLIYLTYLKRRITFAEESVGGPVDVAIISKGDGFIWVKRKHYFKPELNRHFFGNYLN